MSTLRERQAAKLAQYDAFLGLAGKRDDFVGSAAHVAAAALVDELRALGVEMEVRDGKVRCWPAEKVTPELQERIRLYKPMLVALLGKRDWEVLAVEGEKGECLRCGRPWLDHARKGLAQQRVCGK